VIDTPGIRALGLWEPDTGLAATFAEIAELAPACRFADCGHTHEPGCAVRAAVDEGRVDHGRYARYVTLSS
jgi:ribosome biogenesis GTPase